MYKVKVKPGLKHGVKMTFFGGDELIVTQLEFEAFGDKFELVETLDSEPKDRTQFTTYESPAPTDSAIELAAELGVDLEKVNGTGKHGRILMSDVKRAAQE